MNELVKIAVVALVAGLVGGVTAGLVGNQSAFLGSTSHTDSTIVAAGFTTTGILSVGTITNTGSATFTDDVTVGTNGTQIDRINTGFCNLFTGLQSTTFAASSSRTIDCQGGSATASALTGVTAGDVCHLTAPTTTPVTNLGIIPQAASASSTQGYIVLDIVNATGASITLDSTATSSWAYTCIDPS